jgi:hypothetical protein
MMGWEQGNRQREAAGFRQARMRRRADRRQEPPVRGVLGSNYSCNATFSHNGATNHRFVDSAGYAANR